MRAFTVQPPESGQHVIKYCKHLLPKAQNGFLHKMLRKKNITVNGKKADGSDLIFAGDVVRFFFSDETFSMLEGSDPETKGAASSVLVDEFGDPIEGEMPQEMLPADDEAASRQDLPDIGNVKPRILYEDAQLLLFNKPAGLLSQKAKPSDCSANEQLLSYMAATGQLHRGFTPSVCNRLDRNTSGILVFAKSHEAAKLMGQLLRSRDLNKEYVTLVLGRLAEPMELTGKLVKDRKKNLVTVSALNSAKPPVSREAFSAFANEPFTEDRDGFRSEEQEAGSKIRTGIEPIAVFSDMTLLHVHLITGKSHQIRSHLAALGYPIIGDPKYGDRVREKAAMQALSQSCGKKLSAKRQLLHARSMTFPAELPESFSQLRGKRFEAPLPKDMCLLLNALGYREYI